MDGAFVGVGSLWGPHIGHALPIGTKPSFHDYLKLQNIINKQAPYVSMVNNTPKLLFLMLLPSNLSLCIVVILVLGLGRSSTKVSNRESSGLNFS
jgi:hypothetical protein